MYFLSDPLVTLALEHYDRLELKDKVNEGDWFFSTFGPGNAIYVTDRPHERFNDYETLLDLLYKRNQSKYKQIHKGTPFFFYPGLPLTCAIMKRLFII